MADTQNPADRIIGQTELKDYLDEKTQKWAGVERTISYADGRIVTYRYPNGDPNNPEMKSWVVNPEQRDRFVKETEGSGGTLKEGQDGRLYLVKPGVNGGAPTAAPVAGFPGTPQKPQLIERNGRTYSVNVDDKGNVTTTPVDVPAETPKMANGGLLTRNGKTYQVTLGENGQASATEVKGLPEEVKPNTTHTVTGGDGKLYTLTFGPDGNPVGPAKPVEGLPGKPPDKAQVHVEPGTGRSYYITYDDKGNPTGKQYIDQERKPPSVQFPTPQFGQIAQQSQAFVQDLYDRASRGEISWADASKAIETHGQLVTAYVNEQNSLARGAENVLSNATTQRGQDMVQSANRLTASGQAFERANRAAKDFQLGGDAYFGQLALQGALADRYGGLKDTPRENYPAALQQFIQAHGGAAQPAAAPATQVPAGPMPAALAPITDALGEPVTAPPAQAEPLQTATAGPQQPVAALAGITGQDDWLGRMQSRIDELLSAA